MEKPDGDNADDNADAKPEDTDDSEKTDASDSEKPDGEAPDGNGQAPDGAGQTEEITLDDIKEGDTVSVVMNEHIDYNGKEYPIASLPENLMDIIRAGGLVKAMRKLNGLG